jgi:molybdopterin-guanine dinucleotide biosynthesis protein A
MVTDAVILAGGRATEEMVQRTGTPLRALFPYRGKPFVQWVYEALRASPHVERIAIIGPDAMRDVEGVSGADLVLAERESITANLFGAVEELRPRGRVLITACDNPLLSTAAFDDFLSRAPAEAAVAYPVLRHAAFLAGFPAAENVPIRLRDGLWIGGGCVLIQSEAVPDLRLAIERVLNARKSLAKMVRLLGPRFAARFVMKRVTAPEVEQRLTEIAKVPIRLVYDCDPVFPIDIDDPEDWDYLQQWDKRTA